MMRNKLKEPLVIKIIRIITGFVFIFSSFVKGVDPLGTDYRVIDYLESYGWLSLVDYSFLISVFLISVEFLLGIAMIFKLKPKLASLGVLLIMIIFTIITYFDAMYELVPDCGCFGDAIKLTNWETFYKNIVLLIFAFIIYFNKKRIKNRLPQITQLIVLVVFVGLFDWFIYYNYSHLPVVDFRAWKVGNDMKSAGKETVKNYLIYQNKETGEIKEYLSPNYPWNDSVWMSQWEFVNQRIDDSQLVLKHGLVIEDEFGNNYTEEIVENQGYQLLMALYDITTADEDGMKKVASLSQEIAVTDISFAVVTSSTPEDIEPYRDNYNMEYDIYFGDDVELKAMIRSNPGIVLLKNGVVLKKWHHNDFPDKSEVIKLTN